MDLILDILVLAAFVLSVVIAWKRGFFKTLMGLASWLIAVVASFILTSPLLEFLPIAQWFPNLEADSPLVRLAIGVALFFVLSLLLRLLTAVVGKIFRLPLLRTADQLLGAAVGAVNGTVTASALALAAYALCASATSLEATLNPTVYEQTRLVRPLVETLLSFLK